MTLTVKLLLVAALILEYYHTIWILSLSGERSKKRYKRAHWSKCCLLSLEHLPSQRSCYLPEIRYTLQRQQQPLQMQLDLVISQPHCQPVLSCVGGGIAVASAASAALGAISEDSSALGKSLIFVGLAEGVCLYGLIISFMILGKL